MATSVGGHGGERSTVRGSRVKRCSWMHAKLSRPMPWWSSVKRSCVAGCTFVKPACTCGGRRCGCFSLFCRSWGFCGSSEASSLCEEAVLSVCGHRERGGKPRSSIAGCEASCCMESKIKSRAGSSLAEVAAGEEPARQLEQLSLSPNKKTTAESMKSASWPCGC